MSKTEIISRLALTVPFRIIGTVGAFVFLYIAFSYEMAYEEMYPPFRQLSVSLVSVVLGLALGILSWTIPANTIISMFRR